MYHRINLRRCARGLINQSGTANVTTGLLTNPAGTAEYLLVWRIGSDAVSSAQLNTSYQQRGALGTTYTTQPLIPTDAPPPGILSSGNLLTNFTPDFQFASPNAVAEDWQHNFPFAVLPPGWSLAFQNHLTGTDSVVVSVFWEAVFPDRLISPLIGDPDIDG